jgi:uncharacterized protein YbbC (DUF1343 family)
MKYINILIFFCCLVGLASGQNASVILPADAVPDQYLPLLKDKNVALVINQTAVVDNKSLLDFLLQKHIRVKKVFVPEHGFRGTEDAGATIESTTDSATGTPVISLYGTHKKPSPDELKDIDIVVYDLQDVGCRFYTYISTLQYCMEACAQFNVQMMVLDRPNPNGFYLDGPVLETEFQSFVGMQPVPIVYGMTAGEYALMLKGEHWLHCTTELYLNIIKCQNYTHGMKYNLPVAPSPNLRNMAAVYAYPSMCLFEGTVISVGRGTEYPFLQYGNPLLEKKYKHSFTPKTGAGSKAKPLYDNTTCYGEFLGTHDGDILQKMSGGICLDWLINTYNAYPEKDKFFSPFFGKLAGTAALEQSIKNGENAAEIKSSWKPALRRFKKIRKKYLLYDDF